MDIGASVQNVYDNGWAGSIWFWAVVAAVLALGIFWYFTGRPVGPRGR